MIGKMIKNIRKNKKMSLQKLSNITKIDVGHLSHIENGQRNASYKFLKLICDALGISVAQLLSYTGCELNEENNEYGFVKYVPYNKVPLVNLIDYVNKPVDYNGNVMAIVVSDDSMDQFAIMGDSVFVDTTAPVNSDDVGLFMYNNEIIMRKFIYKDSKIKLIPYNKGYKEIEVSTKDVFYIIGKVINKK